MPPAKKPYIPKQRSDRNAVGKVVQKLRRAQGMTRDDLSARAQLVGWNISVFALKRIERGEREVTDIELRYLAKSLKVPAAVLLE